MSKQDHNIVNCAKRIVKKLESSRCYTMNGEFLPVIKLEIERMKKHCKDAPIRQCDVGE